MPSSVTAVVTTTGGGWVVPLAGVVDDGAASVVDVDAGASVGSLLQPIVPTISSEATPAVQVAILLVLRTLPGHQQRAGPWRAVSGSRQSTVRGAMERTRESELRPEGTKRTGRTEPDVSAAGRLLDREPRLALVVFGVVLAASAAFLVANTGDMWFFLDEWQFLADRSATNPDDLLRPHNEHWTTLPILVYRGLWSVFGLNTYLPYQLVAIALHLTAAWLLRVVMRRAGVGPWMATAAASAFVLLGSGYINILRGFQITFTGALVLGLAQLLLADHDDGIDRRDWWGLAAGLGALMCSGVGIVMVGVVALATLVRRGWRMAAFHAAPLAAVYLVWWLVYRPSTSSGDPGLGAKWSFVQEGATGVFDAVGRVPVVPVLLGVILVVGLGLAWRHAGDRTVRVAAAMPAALLVGGAVFLVLTSQSRAVLGAATSREERYLHLGAAFVLPALAVAADALARRWSLAAPVVLVLLLAGVPANALDIADAKGPGTSSELVSQLAAAAERWDVPDGVRPMDVYGTGFTAGWLRESLADGRIPEPDKPPSKQLEAQLRFRLSIEQLPNRATGMCQLLRAPVDRELRPGDEVIFADDVLEVTANGVTLQFWPKNGEVLRVVDGPRTVQLSAGNPYAPPAICQP